MNWKTLDELPENGSLVVVKLPHSKPIVRIYENDSFGLDEDDFRITKWSYYRGQSSLDHNPLSIGLTEGHSIQHSLEWSLSLVR